MGQGTDSCGGWEMDDDSLERGLETNRWTDSSGVSTPVDKMTNTHLRNAFHYAQRRARSANFTSDADVWNEWADTLETQLYHNEQQARTQPKAPTTIKPATVPKPIRGTKVSMTCRCGTVYEARTADIKRGWGKSCSKRCAAIKRTYG